MDRRDLDRCGEVRLGAAMQAQKTEIKHYGS